MSRASETEQQRVADWFDQTYQRDGLAYLRPLDAYPIFLQLLGAQPGGALLDVACGPGQLLRAALMRELQATGIDIAQSAVDLAADHAPDAQVHCGNSESLPFADASFDYVACIGALERFIDREQALAEMRRVGKPTARFCFMVRNSATVVWKLWRRGLRKQNLEGHQDALSLDEWQALFVENGFVVEDVFIDQWQRQRLRRLLRGWRRHDFTRPEPVARPILPLRYANEFIFLLRSSDGQ